MAVVTKAKAKTAAEAPAASPPEHRRFTAASAERAAATWDQPQEFELVAGSPGEFALVRPVDLQTPETILSMPQPLLQRVIQIQNEVQPLQAKLSSADGKVDLDAAQESMRLLKEMHAIYVVAGFVEPQIIASEAQRTNDEQVCVDKIHPADQARFFAWCQEQNGTVNATLTRFRGEPVRELEAR